MKSFLKVLIIAILSLACTKMPASEENYSYNVSLGSTTLLIYGGKEHDEYLGKLNASRYNSKSIWNQYGTYGSKYNNNSPFNDYASYPPILVDKNGKFYGYFTSNKYKRQRANLKLIDIICDNHEAISEDVSGWYDKIF